METLAQDLQQKECAAEQRAVDLENANSALRVRVCVSMSVRPCLHDRLLTPCPAPTDPVGQSGPRGTGSVGDSVGEGYYSVIHIAVLLQCETPSWCLRCRECSWRRQGNYTHASTDAPASGVSAYLCLKSCQKLVIC